MTTQPSPTGADRATSAIVLRTDATASIGVGHAMRLLALAQEFIARGRSVHLAGELALDWVERSYRDAGVTLHTRPDDPAALGDLADRLAASFVVIDGYDFGPSWGAHLRRHGLPVTAMVDGRFGADQDADLYVDQNPGATPRKVEAGRQALAGAPYTLFRDDVLALRKEVAGRARPGARERLSVLAVFGGSDPMGAAPLVAPIVLQAAAAAGVGMDLTVVTPDDAWAAPLREDLPVDVTLTTTGPVTDLAARAARSDLVVTASGSSVWELLCLGVPTAVVCVIDNQRLGYDMVIEADLALGVGHLDELHAVGTSREDATRRLASALGDPLAREARAQRGRELLDGDGRRRVADAIEALRR
ncbi:spore coat protein [Dermacoccus sp. 147Ba]|uniref:PseG/SpsG family protein n=1 Tax=Dermacoccus sp. 147Ba TaxID=2510111 RepID=UPI00101BC78D|nr:spore coat protein [Dermacoccus sp. 147Ba]RYI22696.1 spore coat protein [Dermacoccus sp. 147Ba]